MARLSADQKADLLEQRDFLLASLADLEEEHAAGDVDEHDYAALREDYTARTASVLRALEADEKRSAPRATAPGPTRRLDWRKLGVVAGVVVFALGAGLLVAQASGRRGTGDTLTGDIRQTTADRMEEALVLGREGRYAEAVEVYDEVLERQPDNVEALTYKGWMLYRSGDVGPGLTTLLDAATADPDYPDAHAFLAVVLARTGQTEVALRELERLDELDPPPEILTLVEPLRAELTTATTAVP